MSTAVTFDGAPERGTINFSVGQPSADLLPLPLLEAACERFFAGAVPFEMNYGERQGDVRFRGDSIVGLAPNRITHLGISRTFQTVHLFPNMTVLENAMVGQHCRSRSGPADQQLNQIAM